MHDANRVQKAKKKKKKKRDTQKKNETPSLILKFIVMNSMIFLLFNFLMILLVFVRFLVIFCYSLVFMCLFRLTLMPCYVLSHLRQ